MTGALRKTCRSSPTSTSPTSTRCWRRRKRSCCRSKVRTGNNQMPMADSPQHVAIIMDGNGRWARSRGMPRVAGHRASVKVVRKVIEECARLQVGYLTLFAFSSENWRRPPEEVGMLMGLFLDALVREVADLHKNQVRLGFIGDRASLNAELIQRMQASEELTANNTGLGLMVAVAYGGRWDIAQASRRLAEECV